MAEDAKSGKKGLPVTASTPQPHNPCLSEAVQNAQILLAFASQRGKEISADKEVSADVVKTLVEASSLVAGGRMTDEREAAFWTALNTLAKAVSPVSVTSLRATMDSRAGTTTMLGLTISRHSLARRAVRWYTGIAIITLALLLVFQIYWLFGTSITSDIQKTKKEIGELDVKLRSLQKIVAQALDSPKKPPAGQPPSGKPEDPDIGALKVQKENLRLRKDSSYELLNLWSMPWESAIPQLELDSDDPGKQQQGENIARFETALIVLEVLQRYLLPLLYGLLGTCVFVLRTLASEIKDRTYSESSNIGFQIRLYLGTLGGMVFAWFVIPETADALFKSLSPFALAFLAGYSVELLFAAMDRFLAAFTSKAQS